MDKIDFVLPWVDGSDSAWIKQRNEYLGIKNNQTQDSRFRDWENLQYWFRGVEKFAPWVNHIYFVTWGAYPFMAEYRSSEADSCKNTRIIFRSSICPHSAVIPLN